MRTLFTALVLGLILTGCSYFGAGSAFTQTPNQISSAQPRELPPPRQREEGEQPLLIMLDLKGEGMSTAELNALSQRFWFSMLRTGHFLMVPREHMPRLLAENRIFPHREPMSHMMIGRVMQCDYLLTGQVGKIGDTHVLDTQLLDIATGSVIGVGSVTVRGGLEDLVQRLPGISRELVRNFGRNQLATGPRSPVRGEPVPEPREPDVGALTLREPMAEAVTPEPASPTETPEPVSEEASAETPTSAPVVEETPEPVEETPTSQPTWSDSRPDSFTAAIERQVEFEPEGSTEAESADETITDEQAAFISPAATTRETVDEPVPPTAEERIAKASEELGETIQNFENPYGELNSDIGEAASLIDQAGQFGPDDPMRAELLEQALALEPQKVSTLCEAAIAHFHQQEYAKTRDECLAALHLRPDDASTLTILGAAHHHMSEFPMAVAAHQRALAVDPGNHYAQYNKALSLAEIDPAQAITAFERFIDLAEGVAAQEEFIDRAQEQIDELAATL